jgi:hypothetical protein
MPISNEIQQEILEEFAKIVGEPDPQSVRFTSTERNNATILTLQGQKTDPVNGSTTNTELIISTTQKPNHYQVVGKITSPNRSTEFSKIILANPESTLPLFVRKVLLVQKVCAKSPNIIKKLGNRIGNFGSARYV